MDEIAERIGRGATEVAPELRRLVSLGILKAETDDERTLFSYEPEDEIERRMNRFAAMVEQRELRLSLLALLLRRGIR
ncbi:MAG: hypothetical protein C4521_06445 [Actinobacteria bacterium]|nr:MAG: hypothetical protein C4521_06445 [Actinomycetota bacterium]